MACITEEELQGTLTKLEPLLLQLQGLVEASRELPEGNVLYMHHSFTPNPKNLAKQLNLFGLAKRLPAEDSVVVEVGFNAGHSSLLMLAAHAGLRVVAFDLCEHAYTRACFQALSAAFPGRLTLVEGRSQQTLPAFAHDSLRADLLHIDGDHRPEAAKADLESCARVARPGAVVVFDDVCFSPLAAVWREAHASGLLVPCPLPVMNTSRHGVAAYARPAPKACDALLWDLEPALGHRGRMRHVLVLAPVDHGQDSLLGYLGKHRAWQGRCPKSVKLAPNSTERHQSKWLSLPLRWQAGEEAPTNVHLLAPPFHDDVEIERCMPLADGVLAVVDCAEGLTEAFKANFSLAARRGLQPLLFLNKLDKLLRLETSDEACCQRLLAILQELNGLLQGSSAQTLDVLAGNVLFGRGSLSVAEAVGGWGFSLQEVIEGYARRKAWSEEQRGSFLQKAWGEGRLKSGERGFCALVLRPIRELLTALESSREEGSAKLRQLGLEPPDEQLLGNAWKQSALEKWRPLADTLLGGLVRHVPAPRASDAEPFYAASCVTSADGRSCFALGRRLAAAPPNLPLLPARPGASVLLNGASAVELPKAQADCGTLLGVPVAPGVALPCLMEL